MAKKAVAMIGSFRAQAQNRSGMAEIRQGNAAQGRATLAGALRLARDSQDRSAVAIVIDGVAAATLLTHGGPAAAERAAVLLGAAHTIRGAFDHSSLDSVPARAGARETLGAEAFETAYQRGRELGYTEALALAEDAARPSPGGLAARG